MKTVKVQEMGSRTHPGSDRRFPHPVMDARRMQALASLILRGAPSGKERSLGIAIDWVTSRSYSMLSGHGGGSMYSQAYVSALTVGGILQPDGPS